MPLPRLPILAAALALPVALTVPAEAKTAFQIYAQGRGAYVSSKDHPPGGLQDFALDAAGYPGTVPAPGYGGNVPPPPPGPYGYPSPDGDY